jgi:glycosidase
MTMWTRFPVVYEINTRVWLAELALHYGRRVTLANIPDEEFCRWSGLHFNAIWLMGVWRPSEYSRELALHDQELTAAFSKVLPGWKPEDVASSPYSVADYRVDENLGGEAGLAQFRDKLKDHSIKLLLDFVPNHTAVEHPWVTTNPDFYIKVSEKVLDRIDRKDYFITQENRQIACGRVLQAPSWSDTLQLNHANPNLQQALIDTLLRIALLCDGVRCDTAITGLKEVFRRTWGELGCQMETEFWDRAIAEVKKTSSDFLFIAEIYGEFEWELQQLGFDFTYDKALYDGLAGCDIAAVKQHLRAEWAFTRKLARFTENHDWPRAVEVFGLNSKAASLLTLCIPGLRIIYEGQLKGWRKQLPVYLIRRPDEQIDCEISPFYQRLLSVIGDPAITAGDFRLLELPSDTVVAFERFSGDSDRLTCLVNFGETNAEIAFSTEAFAHVEDYRHVRIISTEMHRSPQFDLWPGGITVRLRGHEGLLLIAR